MFLIKDLKKFLNKGSKEKYLIKDLKKCLNKGSKKVPYEGSKKVP